MKYMMLIKHTDDYRGKKPPQALMDAMEGFVGEYVKQGKFLEGAGLKSSHRGKKIRLHSGKLTVVAYEAVYLERPKPARVQRICALAQAGLG